MQIMVSSPTPLIPTQAQTLEVLQLMGRNQPIIMLPGSDDGCGTLWVLDGQQVPPVIAKFLIERGFVADTGTTELGARMLALTEPGRGFLESGMLWWNDLGFLERLKVRILG